MPHKTHRNMGIRLTGSTGTALVNISADVNSQSLERTIAMLEDTGMGMTEGTFVPGLGHTKIPINGFVNTTTDAIFGPFVSTNSTAQGFAKVVEFQAYSGRYYNGNVWCADFKYSGTKDSLETFSGNLQFTGHVNRTSVAL